MFGHRQCLNTPWQLKMNTLRVIKFFNSMCFWIFIRENLLLLQWERDCYLFGKTEVSMVPYITEQLSDSTMRRHWASGSPAQHLAHKATLTCLRVTLFVRMDALAQTQFPQSVHYLCLWPMVATRQLHRANIRWFFLIILWPMEAS